MVRAGGGDGDFLVFVDDQYLVHGALPSGEINPGEGLTIAIRREHVKYRGAMVWSEGSSEEGDRGVSAGDICWGGLVGPHGWRRLGIC